MASVELVAVRKSFGEAEVIRGVDLAIAHGEFVVFVGPSGCGTSTLLRLIAGLEELGAGEVRIDGEGVNHRLPRDRDIAMVFQSYALYPHMSVAQNMGFALRLAGRPAAEIAERVGKAARMLGLEAVLDRKPRALSGGQRQRVAMGRAIVRNPKVFLFDEPLSNLDAQLRVQMRADIKQLHRDIGTTSIYVTHDQIEAMTMADRIVVLRAGAVEQVGTPLELYDAPRNVFVAGFIGSPAMNLLAGQWSAGNGEAGVRLADGQFVPLPGRAVEAGREVWLGVRPEHLRVDRHGLRLGVRIVEMTGGGTHLLCAGPGGDVTVVAHERLAVRVGETIAVALSAATCHLFDRASGLRIG